MIYILAIIGGYFVIKILTTYQINWKSFFRKGFVPNNDKFGIYCYCGKQGRGKTYSVVEYLSNLPKDTRIYANINTLKNIEYNYIETFEDLLNLKGEHDCVIVFDEIFTALTKGTRLNKEVMSFLSQMRKRRIIFITTAQEWLEINLTFRRYCRYQIECKIRSFWFIGILFKKFYDAELMTYNKDSMEYEGPLSQMTISKLNVYVANSYDTYEVIAT